MHQKRGASSLGGGRDILQFGCYYLKISLWIDVRHVPEDARVADSQVVTTPTDLSFSTVWTRPGGSAGHR